MLDEFSYPAGNLDGQNGGSGFSGPWFDPHTRLSLSPGFPNPFGSSTRVSFILSEPSHVSLRIVRLK